MTVFMSFAANYSQGMHADHCFFEEREAAWFAGMNPSVIIMALEVQ